MRKLSRLVIFVSAIILLQYTCIYLFNAELVPEKISPLCALDDIHEDYLPKWFGYSINVAY